MYCPSCGAEYEPGVLRCADCRAPLVADRADIPAPMAHLGRFHRDVVDEVVAFAGRRGIDPAVDGSDGYGPRVPERGADADALEVSVPAARRDGLRADLVVAWPALLADLDEEQRARVDGTGGWLTGWFDAPSGAWVDRDGRLRVEPPEDEDGTAERSIGPALVALGVVALLLAWYLGPGLLRLLTGVGALTLFLVGVFWPR